MASATITVQNTVGVVGVSPTYAAATAGGDAFVNDGKTQLRCKNGGSGSITMTITSQQKCNQGVEHDLSIVVAASAEEVVGPFDQTRFNDSGGLVQITYSGVTTVTVAALKVSS